MNEDFKLAQSEFVAAIKDPSTFTENNENTKRRMGIYQSLFFNNINNFIRTGFPVLESLIDEHNWSTLVRRFFIEHPCRSPYFVEISKEFVEYLSSNPELPFTLPAFAIELAHYEWLELDISIRKTDDPVVFFEQGDVVTHVSVSPLATLASYRYAVHLIGRDYVPIQPASEQQFYVVYRDRNQEVQFVLLNAVTATLLHRVEQAEVAMSIDDLSRNLTQQLAHLPAKTVVQGMQHTVDDMLKKGILLAHESSYE